MSKVMKFEYVVIGIFSFILVKDIMNEIEKD
jgi:hypothetical protein